MCTEFFCCVYNNNYLSKELIVFCEEYKLRTNIKSYYYYNVVIIYPAYGFYYNIIYIMMIRRLYMHTLYKEYNFIVRDIVYFCDSVIILLLFFTLCIMIIILN